MLHPLLHPRHTGHWFVIASVVAGLLSSCPAFADEALSMKEVVSGIYVYRGAHEEATRENSGAIANIGFIVGDRAVAVIDTGGSPATGRALLNAVRQVTDLPIGYVINTHFHPDHVLGNSAFVAEAPVFVGHANLSAALRARQEGYLARAEDALGQAVSDAWIVMPGHLVKAQETIDLGGRRLLLQAYPPAHTDSDLTVVDEATGTLFAGVLVFLERIPAVDGSILGWLDVLDRMSEIPARQVIPGHGPSVAAWPDALEDERRYLSLIVRETRQVLTAGGTLQDATAKVGLSERGRWQLFDDYNARNVTVAYTELEWE
jgi:quinoprotein relay system zinc metallohydrolase 2